MRRSRPEPLPVDGESVAQVDNRRWFHHIGIGRKGLLAFDEVVEPPDRQPAFAEKLARIPFRPRGMDNALTVGQAPAHGRSHAEKPPLEREEADELRPFGEYGDPGTGVERTDGDREFRTQKRIGQGLCLALHMMPGGNLPWTELPWTRHRNPHLSFPLRPSRKRTPCR